LTPNADGTVSGKPGQINQVFLNLIDNSLRSGAGRISISISATETTVRVLFVDDGPGVPADVAQKIFDPFFSTRDEGGTGLGLNLSRQAVEEAGGRLMLVNPGEAGAEFVVELPNRASAHEASA
jgi:signal transduction histidine kinase